MACVFGFGKLRLISAACAGMLVWQMTGSMPAPLSEAFSAARNAVLGTVASAASEVGSVVFSSVSFADAAPPSTTTASSAGDVVVQGAWSSCGVVPVLVNPGAVGDSAVAAAESALARIARVSGVRFRVVGTTDVVPSTDWLSSEVRVAGYDFPPVVVAWADQGVSDVLRAGWVAGATGLPGPTGDYVSGVVVVDQGRWEALPSSSGPGVSRSAVLLHELGHVLGLGHGPDGHLMAASISDASPSGFSSAERRVLRSLRPAC